MKIDEQMKRFRWLVVLPVIASVALLWEHHRVSYHRRSIETWFDELNGGGPGTNAAKNAILAIGGNAVPFLAAQLTNRPALHEIYLIFQAKVPLTFRHKMPFSPMVTEDSWNRRERAAVMLGELGPAAKKAFPALVNLVSYLDHFEDWGTWNPGLRIAALVALEKIDVSDSRLLTAFPNALGYASSRGVDPVVAQAAKTFNQVKNPSDEIIIAFLRNLDRHDSEVYHRQLLRYSEIITVTNCLTALTSGEPSAREAAAFVFGDTFGGRRATGASLPDLPRETVTNLVECLRDPWEPVRLNAARTLFNLKKSDDATVAVLISLLDSTNSFNRLQSIEILRQIGKAARAALPQLTAMKSNAAAFLAYWADRAIEEIQ